MNSTNIKVISEEIQRLKDKVHSIDIEVPDPSQATDGQILSVDEGKYVISDPDLPSYSISDEGKYVGVNASGELEFSNPPGKYNLDYSSTETETGETWNGKAIYTKYLTGTTPDSETAYIDVVVGAEKIVNIIGFIVTDQDAVVDFIHTMGPYQLGSNLRVPKSNSSHNQNVDFEIVVFYTKSSPTRDDDTDPETKSTKKKTTTKKGE